MLRNMFPSESMYGWQTCENDLKYLAHTRFGISFKNNFYKHTIHRYLSETLNNWRIMGVPGPHNYSENEYTSPTIKDYKI